MKFKNSKIFAIACSIMLFFIACEGDPEAPPSSGNQTCVPTSYEEMLHVPLDIFIVLDGGGSMSGTWNTLVNLLVSFFQQPASEGINVAINIMPSPSASGNICNPGDYNPPQIPSSGKPLAVLPDDIAALSSALYAITPEGFTPTFGALDGTYQYADSYKSANPTHRAVVVFVTDGLPCCGECNDFYGGSHYEDIDTIAALAAEALDCYGLLTYTVSLDLASLVICNAIADAGGTFSSYNVTDDINMFLDALEDIRWANYGCRYVAPDPAQVNPSSLNVICTPSGIGDPEIIPKADSGPDCGIGPSWYFDDPVNPTSILLCPNIRSAMEQDPDLLLQLAIGCPTITKPHFSH